MTSAYSSPPLPSKKHPLETLWSTNQSPSPVGMSLHWRKASLFGYRSVTNALSPDLFLPSKKPQEEQLLMAILPSLNFWMVQFKNLSPVGFRLVMKAISPSLHRPSRNFPLLLLCNATTCPFICLIIYWLSKQITIYRNIFSKKNKNFCIEKLQDSHFSL